MAMKRFPRLVILGLVLVVFARAAIAAEGKSPPKDDKASAAALADLLAIVTKLPMPNLSVLLPPKKLGLLSDNESTIKDNQANLLSGNKTDVDTLSGNNIKTLSDIRILSNLSLQVNINIYGGDGPSPAAAKKAGGKQKSATAVVKP